MSEKLSAETRIELRELFAGELERAAAALLEYETAADTERITMQLLLHFQAEVTPPEAIADAIGILEARSDRAAALVLASAERLLAPSLAEPAREALEGLRRAGVADEPPEGTGELRVASVRRYDGTHGQIYVVTLERPGEVELQHALVAIDGGADSGTLGDGALGAPGERLDIEGLYERGNTEAPEATAVSPDELHAALRDAVARHRHTEVEIPNEMGLALPVVWRAAGGDPAELEGILVGPPGAEAPEPEELIPTPPPSRALLYRSPTSPRNAPCPCGSGLKAKRCCLPRAEELRRQVAGLEDLTMELADRAWEACPRCYDAAVDRVFHGAAEARVGHIELFDGERLEAALWIVWAGGLCEGRPAPLGEHLGEAGEAGAAGMLDASRMRAWVIEGYDAEGGLIAARCPLTGEEAELEAVRAPAGDPAPGSALVARSVPRPEGRYALLGAAPVIAPEAREDFGGLLARLAGECPDHDELWRAHGGELLSAAWCWPEMRDYTLEGEPVEAHHVAFAIEDCEALEEALAADRRLVEGPSLDGVFGERVASWALLRRDDPPAPPMPAEPGVQWMLCDEDMMDPPHLARLELNLDEGSLWTFAPSRGRLEAAERELRDVAGDLLGEEIERDVEEMPSATRRWQRERVDAMLAGVGDLDLPGLSEAA